METQLWIIRHFPPTPPPAPGCSVCPGVMHGDGLALSGHTKGPEAAFLSIPMRECWALPLAEVCVPGGLGGSGNWVTTRAASRQMDRRPPSGCLCCHRLTRHPVLGISPSWPQMVTPCLPRPSVPGSYKLGGTRAAVPC